MEIKTKHDASLVTFLVLLIGVFVLTFFMARPYLLSLVMGGILSLLCRPLYRKFCGDQKRSGTASILVTLVLLLATLGPCAFMIFLGVREAMSIAKFVSENNPISIQALVERIMQFPMMNYFFTDPATAETQIRSTLQSAGKDVSTIILNMATDVPGLILQVILTVISCYFLLVDGPRFYQWIAEKTPLDSIIKGKLREAFADTSISVIWATFAASSAQSFIILCSFLSLGVPAPVLAAGLTFLFAWVPMVGSSPVWITGTIYLLVQGSTVKALLLIILGLSTGIVDNIVRPLVLKGRAKMHPLVSLISIFAGLHFFGILGVFLGPIVAAILISLLEVWKTVCVQYDLIDKGDASA